MLYRFFTVPDVMQPKDQIMDTRTGDASSTSEAAAAMTNDGAFGQATEVGAQLAAAHDVREKGGELHTQGMPTASDVFSLRPRQRLAGRFEITRPLGAGGMSMVYLARDHVLGRDVAIKTLRVDHMDLSRRTRWLQTFRREASSIARLQHPHILTLHDFGVADAIPFLVLEHLDGESLRARLDRGPLSVPVAFRLARQLAEALAHAHDHAVIHRDLKPGNLFVEDGEHLKILDFGIALLEANPRDLAQALDKRFSQVSDFLARSPDVAGTPLYLAPEQPLGNPHHHHLAMSPSAVGSSA